MGRHRAPHVAFNVVIPRVICAKGLFARLQDFVDLGIAKLHFELGANTVSHDWKFA